MVGSQSALARFNLVNVDIRPGAGDHQASAVLFHGESTDAIDRLETEVRNTVISGQPDGLASEPNAARSFLGGGIEFGIERGNSGSILLDNTEVRDSRGDALLGIVYGDGTEGTCEIKSSSLHLVQGSTGATPALSSMHFMPVSSAESGLHLVLSEGANWKEVDADFSIFNNNYRHGVFLEGRSAPDHADGFRGVDFNGCQLANNGLQIGQNAQAHGFFAEVENAVVRFAGHRSAFVNNNTCGLKYLLENGGGVVLRGQYLELTNCTVSRNHGLASTDTAFALFPRDNCPVTVESQSEEHVLETHLSQVTITDNPGAGAAFSIWGRYTQLSQDLLWQVGAPSTVDNCVLRENGYPFGGPLILADLAYYPDASTSPPAAGDQWERMMIATSHSDVGKLGSVVPNYESYGTANFAQPALLAPLAFGGLSFGKVGITPSSVNLIDRGDGAPFAGEPTDNIGAPRAVDYPPTGSSFSVYDVGAFELQP